MRTLDVETPIPPAPPGGPPAGRAVRPPPPPGARDGDDEGARRPEPERPALSNARLGMLMLLGGEAMFFGALIIAFLHLRLGAAVWPPPGQPRLPVGLTAVNTLVLLGSSVVLVRALRARRAGDQAGLVRGLGVTWGLGTLFLVIQGVEWTRLVHFGLRMSSGIYGATFYTLIGIHGAHVLGAVVWLTAILWLVRRAPDATLSPAAVVCCAMYWHFVVALWPVLYLLVYLA